MTTTEVDWSEEGIKQRWFTLINETCPQRRRIKRAVKEGLWKDVIKEMRRLPGDVGRELVQRFFAPLPHGEEVANFIANLLYKITWFKPQGDPKQLRAKLTRLGRQYQDRLKPFNPKQPFPVWIIMEGDWDATVVEPAGEGTSLAVAVAAAAEPAWVAARETAGAGAWKVTWDATVNTAGAGVEAAVGVDEATIDAAAGGAAFDAVWAVAWLIGQDHPRLKNKKSPFETLVKIWALGAWPMGPGEREGQGGFVIFLPKVQTPK